MSLRCENLVSDANTHQVSTLIITNWQDLKNIYNAINVFCLAKGNNDNDEPIFTDYPRTTITKWNCLYLDETELLGDQGLKNVEKIVTIFPEVTRLVFIKFWLSGYDNLIPLLQHPKWANQIISLAVFAPNIDEKRPSDLPSMRQLIEVINTKLPVLESLALEWLGNDGLPDLTKLSCLKVIALKYNDSEIRPFLHSINSYLTGNPDFKEVYLLGAEMTDWTKINETLHSRIARYSHNAAFFRFPQDLHSLCRQFTSLTSLRVAATGELETVDLFNALAQLSHLVHLDLQLNFRGSDIQLHQEIKPDPDNPLRPLAQLNSARHLELHLLLNSHVQVEWLNLGWTMPGLQTIQFLELNCSSCSVAYNTIKGFGVKKAGKKRSHDLLNASASAYACLETTLAQLHPGIALERIIFDHCNGSQRTMQQLLQSTTNTKRRRQS